MSPHTQSRGGNMIQGKKNTERGWGELLWEPGNRSVPVLRHGSHSFCSHRPRATEHAQSKGIGGGWPFTKPVNEHLRSILKFTPAWLQEMSSRWTWRNKRLFPSCTDVLLLFQEMFGLIRVKFWFGQVSPIKCKFVIIAILSGIYTYHKDGVNCDKWLP